MCLSSLRAGLRWTFDLRYVRDKATPLHRAVQEDNLPIVKELMSYGADPYCLVKVFSSLNGKLFSWDCFDFADFSSSDGMKSYLRKYKVCWLN